MEYKIAAALLILLTASFLMIDHSQHDFDKISEFEKWKVQFNKDYVDQQEEIYRMTLFIENLNKIELHNLNKHFTYEAGVNQFTDMTEEEFRQTYLTFTPPTQELRVQTPSISQHIEADGDINWVEKGYVTSIKDQGACGACWAFAAIGPMQAVNKMQGRSLVSLSAQQLMDCSTSYGNQGCSGGLMENAYKYIKAKNITTDDKYPYKGAYQKCLMEGGDYTVKGYVNIQDCKNLAAQLMKIPIAVAVDATKFYNYKGGVFNGCTDKPSLNHAFALVGMTQDYWLGKQQWGLKWGQNGYIKIAKTGNACGICQMASYPL